MKARPWQLPQRLARAHSRPGRAFIGMAMFLAAFLVPVCNAQAAGIAIPREAYAYKSMLIRAGHAFWGLDAPCATFAAQIHAESRWRSGAVSPAGARGMAQFMPATAQWISGLYAHLSANEPANPAWAVRALVTYDRYLWDRLDGSDDCQRMAKVLAAYNGGIGWVRRDEKLAARRGLDRQQWFENVECVNSGRSRAAKKENQAYPRRILLLLEPAYAAAGFGSGLCGRARKADAALPGNGCGAAP